MREIRTYEVRVDGYSPVTYCARSPGKARALAFRDFGSVSTCNFGEFLARSSIRRIENLPGTGERILVAGLPATRVHAFSHGHYVAFMRDDSDEILFSHPADVTVCPTDPA